MKLNKNKANEKNLTDMPPIMTRTVPAPMGGRGPRNRPPLPPGYLSQEDAIDAGLLPPMYTPGWSIPKLRLDNMDGFPSIPSSRVGSSGGPQFPLPPRRPSLSSLSKTKDMLTRFDEAVSVSNPNPKLTKVRSAQLKKEIKTKLGNSQSESKMQNAMNKMRNKFLGDISSELGFGFDEQNSPSANGISKPVTLSALKLSPAKTDSWSAVSATMEKSLKELAADAQKSENRAWVQASGSGNLLKDKIKPSSRSKARSSNKTGTLKEYLQMGTGKGARREVNSEEKLAVISKAFRKTLQPIASRNVRDLIQTPPDNVMEHLSLQHDRALELERVMPQERISSEIHHQRQRHDEHDDTEPIRESFMRGSKTKGIQSSDVNKSTNSGGGTKVKAGSKNLSGLMNFRSLLEIQSANERLSPREEDEEKEINMKAKPPVPITTQRRLRAKSPEHYTCSEMHETLQHSVKSIDEAAKIAQNLGNLMSKVAMQNAKRVDNDASLKMNKAAEIKSKSTSTSTSTSFTTPESRKSIDPELKDMLRLDRNRNPYTPITAEIKKRADRLTEVVEQAERNLKLHGAAFGIKSPLNSARSSSEKMDQNQKTTSTTTTTTSTGKMSSSSTATGMDFGFQTDLKSKGVAATAIQGEFEFVPDMSYTDQLMLKKLRDLKSTWSEN